jgi:hypothetical protein
MGFYYDWLERKWQPSDRARELTLPQRQQIARRRALLDQVCTEIERGGNSDTGLYARLLARALVRTDELLMREHGKQVAVLTDPDMAAFVRAASRN